MSSVRPSDSPSPGPELARARGEVLLEALEERVPGAREHAEATASYAFAAAAELGFDREACLQVREAARLHEVGRLYLDGEAHPGAGYRLALGAGIPEPLCEWILHSGDRFDASGGIPIEARVIAGACEYAALLRERADVGDPTSRWALIALTEQAGGRLDPIVIDALARVVERAAERVRSSQAVARG
jgi:HD-GYP domain-containing protein (c-di-GMP phosphodiesterase class II)